jgi:hypothetical protein
MHMTVSRGETLGEGLGEALLSEAAVLGCALWGRPDALGDLTAEDLADPRHRAVLAAIRALPPGKPVDVGIVLAQLRRDGVRATAGEPWPLVLHRLAAAACVPAGARHHRRAILEARYRRYGLGVADGLREACETGPITDVDQVMSGIVRDVGLLYARLAEATA